LGVLFFCSGALALVYEVLWHREFTLFFGSSESASAAILVAYFAGLGAGSFVFGKLAWRWKNGLAAYGALEVCVGLGALGVSPLLVLFSGEYGELGSGTGSGFPAVLKGLMAFAAIAVPAMAMGGTLPVLAELVDVGKEDPGRRIGWLYVVNTTGATLGALAFPFFLLPAFGMRKTAAICAVGNFVIAGAAFWLAPRLSNARAAQAKVPLRKPGGRKLDAPLELSAPLALALVSGLGTFALQVLWNRAFAQVHENSVSAFALIVTVFIAAIAFGAELARPFLRRARPVRNVLAGCWMGGGLLVVFSPLFFLRLSNNLEYVTSADGARLLALALAVILVPVALLSAGLPLLLDDAIRHSVRSTSNETGLLFGVNITGAIAGALLAGFVLPKALGMWNAVMAVGLLYIVSAGFLLPSWKMRGAALGATAVLTWFALNLDLPRTRINPIGEKLIALEEGAHGIVAVTERGASRRLKLNNHYLLGGTSAVGDERMQAHLPLVLHPAPRTAALLGYGTGITAGAATFHPGVEATGIELVPEVGQFASRYFTEANLGFGARPGTRLVIEDARYFLRVGGRKFDVIMGDLVVPWRPGEGSLYTREHFAQARAALSDDGLLCVWLPMFQLTESEFKIILNTFVSEFEQSSVWRGDFSPREPAIALIAFKNGETALDPESVAGRLSRVTADPSNPQLKFPSAFWMHLVGVIRAVQLDPTERRINSEDRPWLELGRKSGPRSAFVGRELQRWEAQIVGSSRAYLGERLTPESLAAWEAGSWMREFTLSLAEGRQAEAGAAQNRVSELIDTNAFRAIFGPAR
jgi:spermidine synthase